MVEKFGSRIIYDSGLVVDTKVSAILQNTSQWNFPTNQTWELNEIRNALPALPVPSSSIPLQDSCSWTLGSKGLFTVSSLWEHLRTHFPCIGWSNVVWFHAHIPKCSLISWLAIQNRLSTEDRLVLFGIKDSSCCSFCNEEEDHDHLFFNCPFTKEVWDTVSLKSNLTWLSQPLLSLVSLLSNYKGIGLRSTLIKLSFTVTLYHIWIERNFRKFQSVQHPIPTVVSKICTEIRYRLMSLSKLPTGPSLLYESWNVNASSI